MDRVAVFVDGANFFYMQKNDLKWFVDTKKLLKYCANLVYTFSTQIKSKFQFLEQISYHGLWNIYDFWWKMA